MRLTWTQAKILQKTDKAARVSASEIGKMLKIPPGPAGRCLHSLVGHGLMKQFTEKDGTVVFKKTATGNKIAKNIN